VTADSIGAGRYSLERELGRGGMATVWLAHDHELGREVAVKVLAAPIAADTELRARFLREARVAARLSHPNVVGVFDAGEDGDRLYIVMEYVPGESLAHALRRRTRFPVDEAVAVVTGACAALEQAHAAGLVHRDVKPGNLLLRPDGVVKLADFGIAHAAEETRLTQAGAVLGTAAYLAPEQAAGEPVTPAADVYALGAVLYELLTGRCARRIDGPADLAALTRGTPVTPVRELAPEVPEQLEAIVMRSLARNPAYRPPTAGALARELAGGPPTTVPGWRRTSRRQTAVLGAAAVAAAGLAAGLTAAFAGDGDGRPARVEPVPRADDPAARARALAEWLRDRSR